MITLEPKQEVLAPSALEAISAAEINSAIATARRFPRELSVVKKHMLSFATLDQETAESCFYTLPRGGKNIQGPSVRLAEIALSCYGNIRAGSRIIHTVTEGDNPHVVIQAVCMDLENNVSVSIEKRRRITSKKDFKTGGRKPIDEDDVQLAGNAGAAIAFRDAVFKVVPLALIKPVFDQAKKVAIGDAKTLGDRRLACIAHFAKMGISQERVLAKLEVKAVDDVTLEHVETLLGLHNAIKDGEASLDEAFPVTVPTSKPSFVKTAAQPPQKSDDGDLAPQKPQPAQTTAAAAPEPAAAQPKEAVADNIELTTLILLLAKEGITPEQLLAFSAHKKFTVAENLEATDKRTLKNLTNLLGSKGGTLLKELKAFVEASTP